MNEKSAFFNSLEYFYFFNFFLFFSTKLSSMEDFTSLWSYQEGMDELKQKLLYTTIELESVKMEANQEMIKNKENVKNLLNLLQMAYKERDEAKNELQKVLNKLMLLSSSNFQPESPPFLKANSSITAEESYNNPQSQLSHGSGRSGSPVAVSSPDCNSISNVVVVDPSGLVIENIVKGKKLPEKGRLLQSVMEAGPLLQTLLVAGPLPRWRNPPPLSQQFKIPPVLMNNDNMVVDSPNRRMCSSSSSMLNFSGVPNSDSSSSSCFFNHNNSTFASQFPSAKRQRFH